MQGKSEQILTYYLLHFCRNSLSLRGFLILKGKSGWLCCVFRLDCSDVVDDSLRPAVDVRPSLAVADAVLVRGDIHHVRARRPGRQDAVMRLLIGNDDQTIEFAPLLLVVEQGQCALE